MKDAATSIEFCVKSMKNVPKTKLNQNKFLFQPGWVVERLTVTFLWTWGAVDLFQILFFSPRKRFLDENLIKNHNFGVKFNRKCVFCCAAIKMLILGEVHSRASF